MPRSKAPRSRQSVQLMEQSLELSYKNVRVTVAKEKKCILDGISGYARCGELMALMGATGSGKTTLLTTLAHRNEAGLHTSGSIRYGDHHRYVFCKALKPRIGFVEQDDIVLPELTVRQSLTFTAALRMGSHATSTEQRARVDEVIAQLRLGKCADTLVGSAEARGISGGERKRLCIATELLTMPRLLFLDEPTSGWEAVQPSAPHVLTHTTAPLFGPLPRLFPPARPNPSLSFASRVALVVPRQLNVGVSAAMTDLTAAPLRRL